MLAEYRVIYGRANRFKKDGTASVLIEVYYRRKRKYISTGISVKPEEWDSKTQRVNRKHPDYQRLNSVINKTLSVLNDFEYETIQNKGVFSLSELDNFGTELNARKSFASYMRKKTEQRQIAESTKKIHRRAVKYLCDFKGSEVMFSDLTYGFISDYDRYLFDRELRINSVHNMHKAVKTYINIAVKEELIQPQKNPYLKFKAKQEKTTRTILTEDEIQRLTELKFTFGTPVLKDVRDMFLFSCYTGLRFSDLQAVRGENFQEDNGLIYMILRQEKTNTPVEIPLHGLFKGKAIPIYRAYFPENRNKHLFPRITNQAANRLLKVLAMAGGIDKTLSFHIARHTFGTLLAKYSGDQFLIQNLMGHSDIKTSMTYIHLSKKHIEDKLKGIEWK